MKELGGKFNCSCQPVHNFHGMKTHLHMNKNCKVSEHLEKKLVSSTLKMELSHVRQKPRAIKTKSYSAISGEFTNLMRTSTAITGLFSTRS